MSDPNRNFPMPEPVERGLRITEARAAISQLIKTVMDSYGKQGSEGKEDRRNLQNVESKLLARIPEGINLTENEFGAVADTLRPIISFAFELQMENSTDSTKKQYALDLITLETSLNNLAVYIKSCAK